MTDAERAEMAEWKARALKAERRVQVMQEAINAQAKILIDAFEKRRAA